MFFYATGITPAMIMRLTEIGSQYLGAFVDSTGQYLDGAKTYKLTLPPNIRAARFWSLTIPQPDPLDAADRPALSHSGQPKLSDAGRGRRCRPLHHRPLGPAKPQGVRDGNWIQIVPGKGWSTIFRLHSPLEPCFDKTWRPQRNRTDLNREHQPWLKQASRSRRRY